MARTKTETIREVTTDYLRVINKKNPPLPETIEADILEQIASAFDVENAVRPKYPWKPLEKLVPAQIADIILTLHDVVNINFDIENIDRDLDLLSIYQETGDDEGIYISDEDTIKKIAYQYCYTLSKSEANEVIHILKLKAQKRHLCNDPNLIAVNNGIFNYKTKQLFPFSPEYVFIAKSRVKINPNATNVVIHNDEDGTDWDIESWMHEVFDDPEIEELIWQILGAIVRPNVPWGKSAWFYSESGNNGKGTLCELMRQLCGKGSYAAIPLSDFDKDFVLEPLLRSTAIITDENSVGTYIDKAANLKAIITQDVIQVNRKYKTPIAFRFKGFMVQCLNEMPRIKDKSDSFYRRQIFVPFTKCFTGAERKYIKHDYLKRPEVLEYVLWKVLNMDYYELSIPKACQMALEEYKVFNDPVRQFASEIMDQLVWDFVPFSFLTDLYNAWYKKNVGGEKRLSAQAFKKELLKNLKDYPEWVSEGSKPCRPGNHMSKPEPLIAEYGLKDWMNPMYMSSIDIQKKCIPVLKSMYNGIRRV